MKMLVTNSTVLAVNWIQGHVPRDARWAISSLHEPFNFQSIINIISVFILILLLYFFSLEYYFFQCHVICTIRGSCRLLACLCKVFVWWIANFDWIVNNIPRRSFFSTIKKKNTCWGSLRSVVNYFKVFIIKLSFSTKPSCINLILMA